MRSTDVDLPGISGPGLLWEPPNGGPARGGVVALHGASRGEREQPLFEHLARTLVPLGYAVLSYDRRPRADGADVPLMDQCDDARTAAAVLERRLRVPVGIFAFSQGAWAACLRAADGRSPRVAFAALVGCSGVSPAEQMRYYTDELLRRSGFSPEDRRQLSALRRAVEDALRGSGERAAANLLLAQARDRPWFHLAYLPDELATDATWDDMDFDPAPVIDGVTCPTLLCYGADEECVPASASTRVWQDRGARDLTVVELPGCGHYPALGSAEAGTGLEQREPSAAYTAALSRWFAAR